MILKMLHGPKRKENKVKIVFFYISWIFNMFNDKLIYLDYLDRLILNFSQQYFTYLFIYLFLATKLKIVYVNFRVYVHFYYNTLLLHFSFVHWLDFINTLRIHNAIGYQILTIICKY